MASRDYLGFQRERVDEALRRLLEDTPAWPEPLGDAIRHAVLGGGKRIRPVLTLTASEAVATEQGDPDAALQAAVAIELLHSYTLVHDDLPSMDNDLVRRGQPTVHARFGEAQAILAGDALQALAFDVVARRSALDPSRSLALVRILAQAAGPAGVVGGQVEDIASRPLDLARLSYIQLHKTGDLFRAALALGAVAGGGSGDDERALSAFGQSLGVAFQIVDDILDADGEPDAESTSCLRLWSRDKAREMARAFTMEAVANLAEIPGTQASAALSDLAEDLLSRLN